MDSNLTKRISERISSNIKVRFFCGDTEYSGTAANLSKSGMFINIKEMFFPFASHFEIFILLKEEVFKIHARVKRVMKSTGLYDGIGVELMNPPKSYFECIDRLRAASINPSGFPYPE